MSNDYYEDRHRLRALVHKLVNHKDLDPEELTLTAEIEQEVLDRDKCPWCKRELP